MTKTMKVWLAVASSILVILLISIISFLGGLVFAAHSISSDPETYQNIICNK